jgi:hypothetical protein
MTTRSEPDTYPCGYKYCDCQLLCEDDKHCGELCEILDGLYREEPQTEAVKKAIDWLQEERSWGDHCTAKHYNGPHDE